MTTPRRPTRRAGRRRGLTCASCRHRTEAVSKASRPRHQPPQFGERALQLDPLEERKDLRRRGLVDRTLGAGEELLLDLFRRRSEEHTSELQSQSNLVCRLLLEKKKNI